MHLAGVGVNDGPWHYGSQPCSQRADISMAASEAQECDTQEMSKVTAGSCNLASCLLLGVALQVDHGSQQEQVDGCRSNEGGEQGVPSKLLHDHGQGSTSSRRTCTAPHVQCCSTSEGEPDEACSERRCRR